MTITLPFIIESLGTLAFAISGIRLAAAKQFDWFGAYVVGLITAIGGGTIRDLLLDQTAFWMLSSVYLIVTGIAMVVVILLRRYLVKLNQHLFYFRHNRLSSICRSWNPKNSGCGLSILGSYHHGNDYRCSRRRST